MLAVLAGTAAALLAMPASWSDYAARDGSGLGPAELTPYPPMLPVLIVAIAVAGVVGALRPAAVRASAVLAALAALQAGGIALVASRDWRNYAGAGGASPGRAAAGSLLAVGLVAVAVAAVGVSVLLYRTVHGSHQPHRPQVVGAAIAGVAIAVLLPVLLCAHWNYSGATAAGQFFLWWSLPWGAGIAAAGTVRDAAARQAAFLGVLASVLLALLCVAAPTVQGFGVRLPG
ncbi:hypothetical protein GCM10010172_67960 [Paractinoplanes ferrugineus]|uniref:Integral membrane protein n=1 Tax=Paractinoplanes ferrugineus TaxID=113564 RepID=A0A919JA43_9ACTN|nr:hypothetical protein Afe05nite_83900 [Actinoplanes ferrugineus]